jgi:Fe2+ or Zn2+ uptake regulation protein
MAVDLKNLERVLTMHNIKPSHHRLRILRYLTEHKNHPTVDYDLSRTVGRDSYTIENHVV